MKHIVSFSGGKDSTAMLLKMVELKMPIDEIRFFDAGTWDYPHLADHINKVEKYIKIPIHRMKFKYTYDELFYHPKNSKIPYSAKGGFGWPVWNHRWCTGKKMETLRQGLTRKNTIEYVGIALDEMQRAQTRSAAKKMPRRFPLIELSMTERDCLNYCYSKGFRFSDHYNYFARLSCWCCPFRSISDLKNLWQYFPSLWKRLTEMQKLCKYPFNSRGRTVNYYAKRFAREEKEKIPT